MKFPSRYVNLDAARRRHGDRVDRFGAFLSVGDAPADAAVDALAELPRPARDALIDRALAEGPDAVPDAPEALRALFRRLDHVPYWVDWSRVDRGGRAFLESGILGGLVLGAGSLVAGYCSPAGNKPLVFSGRLASDVPRRLAETSRFVEVVSAPGGMRRGAEGFRACVKVRLMHASVRRALVRSPRWRADDWGVPINQCDSCGTLLLFSYTVHEWLARLGHVMTPRERDDFLHLWRYAGYVLGVEEELLCATHDEAAAQWDLLSTTQDPPDDDARALARALMESGRLAARTSDQEEAARRRIPFAYALSRYLIGDAYADALGYPKSRWSYAFPVAREVHAAGLGRLRTLGPAGNLAFEVGQRYWREVTLAALKGVPAGFSMPDDPAPAH
ncbi:MAG: oxygenase MpaB family protein [Polyangiales bacterium]